MAGPEIDEDLVRRLLAAQHPDLADRPVRPLARGWDNQLFRLGEQLVVRLPRRIESAHLVAHEHRWVPTLLTGLPPDALATSAPERQGRPGEGYPWAWSISRWLPGDVAARRTIDDPADAARRLGRFLAALHRPAPPDAPANPYRGVPLAERDVHLEQHLDRFGAEDRALPPGVTRTRVEDRWAELREVADWDGPALWLHGDLHAANLLVHDGRLSAVLDWGDLTSGDPATDLSVAWGLLPPGTRAAFRQAAGEHRPIDDATWQRAEAWALALQVAYLSGSEHDSPLLPVARRTLTELLA